jgi:hypothetical protein
MVWSRFGTWRGFDSNELCLVLIALALVLNEMSEKLGCLEWWWLGGIYSPQPPHSRWGGCLSMGVPDSPVRQPRHPTVRVLTVSTVGAFDFLVHRTVRCCTGQVLFTVRCAFWHCSNSARTVRALFMFAGDRWS